MLNNIKKQYVKNYVVIDNGIKVKITPISNYEKQHSDNRGYMPFKGTFEEAIKYVEKYL